VTNDGGRRDPDREAESEPFGTLPGADGGARWANSGTGEAGDDFPADYDSADIADLAELADLADFTDETDETGDGAHTALPPKVEAWRRRSATGAILTGFALGLQQALGKEQEQPAVIMQTSGDPPADLPVEAEVEQGRPRQSVVNIRPWLLPDRRAQADSGSEADSSGQHAAGTEDA
jgi:hypothetical protein